MNSRFFVIAGMILAAAVTRLVPHPWNFTAIGAMALFGGAHLADRRAAFAVPLVAMLLSDLYLAGVIYGWSTLAAMPLVYVCFALTVAMGLWLRNRRRVVPIAAAGIGSAVLFYIVTNFGVWAEGTFYPRTAEGLVACYVAGLPYFNNFLLANLLYSLVLFGGLALAERQFGPLREAQPLPTS
jgi:hypothetical protein